MNFVFKNSRYEIKAVTGNEIDESNYGIIMTDLVTGDNNIVQHQDYEACERQFNRVVQDIVKGIRPAGLSMVPVEKEFIFQASDYGLSYNPTLTIETDVGCFYLGFDKSIDDVGGTYFVGFIATNNNNGGEADQESTTLDSAIQKMADLYRIKPKDDREFRNFKKYVELSAKQRNAG